jgi:sugar lactone lactonase YvrE
MRGGLMEFEVLADGMGFLESPRWRDGHLWVSDLLDDTVLKIGPDGQSVTVAAVPGKPGGMGFLPDGTPLIASMYDRILYRIENGSLTVHADLSRLAPRMINDMVVDARGRAYLGDFGFNPHFGEEMTEGAMLLVEPDGRARAVAAPMIFPNGMVIDRGRLIVSETRQCRMISFAILGNGDLADRRIHVETEGGVDGCCLDVEGGLWMGIPRLQKFVRAKDGHVFETVPTPGRRAVACQLGGEDGRTLFLLTHAGAPGTIGPERLGRVETMRVEIPGAGSP